STTKRCTREIVVGRSNSNPKVLETGGFCLAGRWSSRSSPATTSAASSNSLVSIQIESLNLNQACYSPICGK
ncbi:unnamed protein product, partial [Musa acuminata var. zebrina]